MRRAYTFISPFSLALALIMICFLSLSVWFRGGMAFSPGKLTASGRSGVALEGYTSHADFETECQRCHRPVEISQNDLCLDCHQSISQEIAGQSGIHGKKQATLRCAACHPDHRGRDFDPAMAALPLFDHSETGYSLDHHQLNYDLSPIACSACHNLENAVLTADAQRCNTCHAKQDAAFMIRHIQDFGDACLYCHDGQDGLAQFDHADTYFPLQGKHSALNCTQCHPNARPDNSNAGKDTMPVSLFSGVSISCADCHPLPASHEGVFDSNCINCHTPAGWKPAILEGKQFNHDANTDFSLAHHQVDYQGLSIACATCHPGGFSNVDTGLCSVCHSGQDADFILQHTAQYGFSCLECHDGQDRMRDFNHQVIFPLDGAHAQVACLDCHKDGVYRSSTSQCVQCHAEPTIHAGFFGLECQDCHDSNAWSPAYLRAHSFPLDHGASGQTACQVCHPVSYVDYTCYGCHDHQPDQVATEHLEHNVSPAELPNCTQCHPTGQKEDRRD
jgi:hypothetical protein